MQRNSRMSKLHFRQNFRLTEEVSRTDLCGGRRVGFFKKRPDSRLDLLPDVERPRLKLFLESELLHDVLLRRLVGVQVETVEDLQRLLRVSMRCVRHPAAWLHLQPRRRQTIFRLKQTHKFKQYLTL